MGKAATHEFALPLAIPFFEADENCNVFMKEEFLGIFG